MTQDFQFKSVPDIIKKHRGFSNLLCFVYTTNYTYQTQVNRCFLIENTGFKKLLLELDVKRRNLIRYK